MMPDSTSTQDCWGLPKDAAEADDWSVPGPRRTRPAEMATGTLVRLASAGDESAWNALVDRFTRLLWSVPRAYRLDPTHAADVVQVTWLRLVEHLDRIQDPERLPGWLVTTARRECLRVLGRGRGEYVGSGWDEADQLPDETAEPLDTKLLADERDAALWRCLRPLSERCQRLLRNLIATPPPTYVDGAMAVGIPVGRIGPTRGRCPV